MTAIAIRPGNDMAKADFVVGRRPDATLVALLFACGLLHSVRSEAPTIAGG